MKLLIHGALLATLFLPAVVAAATARAAAPVMIDAIAVPASSPIVLDGKLTEAVWEQAPAIKEFVQREPAEGSAPSQRTDARIAYDSSALYVAVRAHDTEPERIVGMLTRRDQRSPSDWIKIVVDSYFDRRSAYEFAVNPVGVKTDRYYFNDGASDDSWDAVWDVRVARDADGWTAEFRIPFSQLRFNSSDGGPVGFAVIREVGRLAETSTWPLLSRNANGFVSQFAEVRGLRMSGPPKKLELLPYTLGSFSLNPTSDNPFVERTDPAGSLGLDLKYAVRPGLTVTATVNPDFGQVEADPAVVNLDAFETFFQERRPFFVEGSGTFQFNVDCSDGQCTGLFYSRRIGRSPQASASLADGEYAESPLSATILGAAKVTGRVGKFSIGALSAVTSEEEATIGGLGLARRAQAIEPLSGYSVIRARREFANQSNIGFMMTSTNRKLAESLNFLPEDSYSGGIDYDIRLSRRFNLSGFWAGSRVEGTTEAVTRLQRNTVHAFQRPDADHVELDVTDTVLSGQAGAFNVGKIAGEKTRFSANYGFKSPGFDVNDLGFQRRADERYVSHWFQMRDQVPGRFTRSFIWNLNQYAGWNFAGDRLWNSGNVNMHWTWKNFYTTSVGFNVNGAPFRDRITRGGPGVFGNSSLASWHSFGTDGRKSLSFFYNGYVESDRKGTTRANAGPSVTWRPTAATSVSTGFRYNVNNDDAQWVANQNVEGHSRYVFGRLKQRTSAFNFRVNYTLTPNLSIQTYAEPFVSAGAYSDYKLLVNGRAPEHTDRYRAYAYGGNADFNIRSFRTTNVLRWEYQPGSSMFVVWQQNRSGFEDIGSFDFGRDFGGAFSAPAHNVFLVKLSYWLNM
ncbi:MAG: carbohydrate binding family 9 domain-containing protein [Acidobacteria bacterium]|nr:carbohydrate binding family 9 domain-containing protein [Acidobacteriota bacterium]